MRVVSRKQDDRDSAATAPPEAAQLRRGQKPHINLHLEGSSAAKAWCVGRVAGRTEDHCGEDGAGDAAADDTRDAKNESADNHLRLYVRLIMGI